MRRKRLDLPALHFVEGRAKKRTNCGRDRAFVQSTPNYARFKADAGACRTCKRSTAAQLKLYQQLAKVYADA